MSKLQTQDCRGMGMNTTLNEIATIDEILSSKIPVIVNPAAGGPFKDLLKKNIEQRLGKYYFEYLESHQKGGITKIVTKEVSKRKKFMLIVGGDGTYNEAVNTEANLKDVVIGFLNGGTSSDFSVNANTRHTARVCNALQEIMAGESNLEDYVKPADIIQVTYDEGEQVKAMNMFSFGFTGLLCKRVEEKRKRGGVETKIRFSTEAFRLYREKIYKPIDISFSINNGEIKKGPLEKIFFMGILNGGYAGGGMNFNPNYVLKDLEDGFFEGFVNKEMKNVMQLLNALWHVAILKDNKIIEPPKNQYHPNGHDLEYNSLNTHHLKGIKTIDINIRNINKGTKYYFEVDGEPHRIYKPGSKITVEVLAGETNLFHIPKNAYIPLENLRMRMHYEMNPGFTNSDGRSI